MDPQLYRQFYEIEDRFWWSVYTRRVFFQLIAERAGMRRGRALDVGCGTGAMLRELSAGGWTLVAGCDDSTLALGFCRQRGAGALVRASAPALPFADASMDLVLALDVIEHLDDDVAALREMARVCRPDGHLLIHVPAFPILWSDKDARNHHRRRYRRAALRAAVAAAGLDVERLFFLTALPFPAALARALAQRLAGGGTSGEAAAPLDGLYRIPAALNRALIALMGLERRVVTRVPVPFGMSLACLARRR